VRGLSLPHGACKQPRPPGEPRGLDTHHSPQSSPVTAYIFELLSLADRHSAKSLKTACIENLFVYGQHLFKDAAIETLEPRLLVELLRDFADRRAVHMPSPPAPPPPPEKEAEEEDDDDPVQEPYQMVGGKRMRKRKGSA
jgi:hypothetical protein